MGKGPFKGNILFYFKYLNKGGGVKTLFGMMFCPGARTKAAGRGWCSRLAGRLHHDEGREDGCHRHRGFPAVVADRPPQGLRQGRRVGDLLESKL